jgi:hypothetical protein
VHAIDPDRRGEILWQRKVGGWPHRRHSVGHLRRHKTRLRRCV